MERRFQGRRGSRVGRWAAGALPVGLLASILCAQAPEAEGAPGAAPAPSASASTDATTTVTPPVVDDVEQMCALLTSCDNLPIPPSLLPKDFASCVKQMEADMTSPSAVSFSLTLRECGLRANSCNTLRACALRGAKPDVCTGRGKTSAAGFCDSDGRAVSCFHEKVLAVRDCPRGGEQCAVREGEALCTLGACPADVKEGAPATCSASGKRILKCEKGRLASLDCGAFGLRCTTGADGKPGCSTASPTCTKDAKRCEGNVAVGCFNGHETRVDCAAAGLTCNGAPGATQVGSCYAPVADSAKCDPSTAAVTCNGATITYCANGKTRSYFCKAMGFAKCVKDGKGARCSG
ncbi:MAG TPA: hypothetical protein VF407_05645 [Polyangiaceae bacterium]